MRTADLRGRQLMQQAVQPLQRADQLHSAPMAEPSTRTGSTRAVTSKALARAERGVDAMRDRSLMSGTPRLYFAHKTCL